MIRYKNDWKKHTLMTNTNEGLSGRRILSSKYVILAIFTILFLVITIFAYQCHTSTLSKSTPALQMTFNVNTSVINGPMVNNSFFPPPKYYTNVTQGNDLKINVTLTSTGHEELVYIKNVQLWWYNPEVNLYTWSDPPNTGNDSNIQANAFSYFSSPNPVSLQPSTSNSTILTLHIAKNAPIGQYSMYINLEAELKQPVASSEFVELNQAYWFAMIINPS
jgi:hypothetical protein